jgi:hypothetical protein
LATTDIHGWPLPDGTDAPVVHQDMKTLADVQDGQVPFVCTSTTRPVNVPGLIIYETDTQRTRQGNGTRWNILSQPWRTFTPTSSGWGTSMGTSPQLHGWYCITADDMVQAYMRIVCGAGATVPPSFPYITVGLPYPVKSIGPGPDMFTTQVYGDGGHLYDGFGGGLRRILLASSSTSSDAQIFAFPVGGAGMQSLAGAGYPFKEGTILCFDMKYRAEIPQ